MDGFSFVAAIVKAIAWPATLVVFLLLFKKPIAELIPRVRTIRIGSVEASAAREYGEEIRESLRANTETLRRLQEDLQSAQRAGAAGEGGDEPDGN